MSEVWSISIMLMKIFQLPTDSRQLVDVNARYYSKTISPVRLLDLYTDLQRLVRAFNVFPHLVAKKVVKQEVFFSNMNKLFYYFRHLMT